ncbi:MAG TPA: GNAT family N-acetyltransferase [Gammaproteobacteria bacterium]|nr:GNAT family N-acetyltransferase [Gammaproteobacteria bacterium]
MKENIIELSPDKYSLALDFFDKSHPNYPVAMAVFEGNNPGQLWVDKLIDPSVCLLITHAGYSFIKTKQNNISEPVFSAIVEILKKHNPKVVCQPMDFIAVKLKKQGFVPRQNSSPCRIHFNHAGEMTLINKLCETLPSDCEVKKINAELLKKSSWLNYLTLFYGTEENFLQKGFGFALVRDAEIVSEAFACYIGGNCVEIGYVTSEHHRGKGYAPIVSAFLLKEIFNRGLSPIASCDVSNPASAKTAQSLGFEENMRYDFLVI